MLLLKMVLSPALIGIASWVSRRWGAAAGGWFAALPLTSGPVMFVIALERGPAFAAAASLGTLMAVISLAAFILVYGWLSQRPLRRVVDDRRIPVTVSTRFLASQRLLRRFADDREGRVGHHAAAADARRGRWSWIACSLAGCVAYLGCTWMLRGVSVSLPIAFVIVCGVLLVTLRAMPVRAARVASTPAVWWDIPLRMMLAAALVFTLTRIAGTLGPRLSGLLTPFPIAVAILAAFTHHFDGPDAAARLLRGLVAGLMSFAIFFLVAGLAVARWPPAIAFAAATLAALAWHGAAGLLKGDVRAAVVHRWRMARGV